MYNAEKFRNGGIFLKIEVKKKRKITYFVGFIRYFSY